MIFHLLCCIVQSQQVRLNMVTAANLVLTLFKTTLDSNNEITPGSATTIGHLATRMPRTSPTRSSTVRSWSVGQTFIDEPIGTIEARIVHEKDLESTHLQWLLGPDSNSPRSVGISPAYSQSGGLPAIACAFSTRVLIINFHSSKPYRDNNSSGTQRRNTKRRNILEEELLCHPLYTHCAFDLAQIALSLRLHLQIHIANAIDIQSAVSATLPDPTRDVIESVQLIINDVYTIRQENITSAFESILYESNKEKDLTALVQRAWLCSHLAQYDLRDGKGLFSKAPKVDMRTFSEEVSHAVRFAMR
jgi:hypothetical protein